ncbi:hypothetical protein HY605_01285, partial [Candidatus Peregrinibacteria bacterium]|nr:hypothetical protein [Candidatus Peregrinibacteria bacterium]
AYMNVIFYCGKCYTPDGFDVPSNISSVNCKKCDWQSSVNISESIKTNSIVDKCVLCNCGSFYTDKDFNRLLGCFIMVGAIVAYIWLINIIDQWALFVLLGAALVDLVFYMFVGTKTVCYRCLAEYRGFAANPEHKTFDNNTAARYAESKAK